MAKVFSYIQTNKLLTTHEIPAIISREHLENILENLSVGIYKRELTYVGEVVDTGNRINIYSPGFCYVGIRDHIVKDTESILDFILETYGELKDGTKLYYDSGGHCMGYKVPGDTVVYSDINENYMTGFDEVCSFMQLNSKLTGKQICFSFCGRLYCTPDTNVTQMLTAFIAYKLTSTTFTRDFVVVPGDSPTIVGAQFLIFLIYDTYFTNYTKSKTLDEIETIVTYLVGGLIASGIFTDFVIPDYNEILSGIKLGSIFSDKAYKPNSVSVNYNRYCAEFETLHKEFDFIYIIPPLQMDFDGITLDKEFIKEILVSSESKEFIFDLGYPMAERARDVVTNAIKTRFNPSVEKVTIYIP